MLKDSPVFLIIFLGYFLSLVFYFINFEFQKDSASLWGKKIVNACLILHFIFLLALLSESRRFAITNLSEYLYVGSFLILLVSFVMEWRYKAKFLMLFSLPTVLLCSLAAILLAQSQETSQTLNGSWWLWVHTGLIVTGFASLITALSSAVMYLLQSSQLKSKHLGKIFLRLPSLNTLDKIHFSSLSWGGILFSLGVLSGLFWAKDLKELTQVLQDPKVILSILTCLMYWVILSLRLSALRRGQKIAVGTVLLFALLLVTLMSSYYAPSGFHKGF